MRRVFVNVCRKSGCETYFTFLMRGESQGRRIYDMLNDLAIEGQLDTERDYIIIAVEPNTVQVTLVIHAEHARNHDEIVAMISRECIVRLSLQPSMQDVEAVQHADLRAYAQRARAAEN